MNQTNNLKKGLSTLSIRAKKELGQQQAKDNVRRERIKSFNGTSSSHTFEDSLELSHIDKPTNFENVV